jgi:hypothetical protein
MALFAGKSLLRTRPFHARLPAFSTGFDWKVPFSFDFMGRSLVASLATLLSGTFWFWLSLLRLWTLVFGP